MFFFAIWLLPFDLYLAASSSASEVSKAFWVVFRSLCYLVGSLPAFEAQEA